MRLYQKWLSAGLLALTPSLATAGAIDSPILKPGQRTAPAAAAPRAARKSRPAANQDLADQVAKALHNSRLNGYEIDIDARDGIVTLDGFVSRNEQRGAAAKAAKSVPGVTEVKNRLRVAEPVSKPRVDQSAAQPSGTSAMPGRVRTASYQAGSRGSSPIQQAAVYSEGSEGAVGTPEQPPSMPAGMPVNAPQAAPVGYAMYGQPNVPNNACPMYCQNQTSAGAWPYMGPFYPYPQCPLGWRKVSMYWDEGLWKIDFGSRKPWWQ